MYEKSKRSTRKPDRNTMGLSHLEPIREYQEAVDQDTWGHLAPKKNTTYKGRLLVSNTDYGNIGHSIVQMEWDNLEDSPWIYDHVNEWLWENRDSMEDDGIYLIKATFRNYRMWGKIAKIMSLEMLQNSK